MCWQKACVARCIVALFALTERSDEGAGEATAGMAASMLTSSRWRRGRWLVYFLLCGVTAGAASALAPRLGSHIPRVSWVMALAFSAFPVLWLVDRWTNLRERLYDPAWLFPSVFVPFLLIGSYNFVPVSGVLGVDMQPIPSRQWLIYACALAGYLCGCGIASVVPTVRGPSTGEQACRALNHRTLIVLTGASLCVGCAGFLLMVHRGGVPILQHRFGVARVTALGSGFVTLPFYDGCYFAMFLSTIGWAELPRRRSWAVLVWLAGLVALASTGNRGPVLVPLAVLVLASSVRRERPPSLFSLYAGALAGLSFIALAGTLRDARDFGPGHFAELRAMGVAPALVWLWPVYAYMHSPLGMLAFVVRQIPTWTPFQYGGLVLDPLFSILRPGHHHSSDYFFRGLLNASFNTGYGLPATFMATFYADAGLIGVLLGSALMGLWCRLSYLNVRRLRTPYHALQYGWVMQAALLSIYGAFGQYLDTFSTPVVLWLMWRVCRSYGGGRSRTQGRSIVIVQHPGSERPPTAWRGGA